MSRAVMDLLEKMREPLGLDRWTHYAEIGPGANENATATCTAMPEYKSAWLTFDPDKLRTGDDLGEIVAHELAHCPTWPLFQLCEDYARLAAGLLPKYARRAARENLIEQARKAGEDVTTQVGHTYIRLLRRIWDGEAKLKDAETDLKSLRKRVRELERLQSRNESSEQ